MPSARQAVLGVLALVAMISITAGAREEALVGAQSLGLDKLRIEAVAEAREGRSGRSRGLTSDDARSIDMFSGVDVQTTYFDKQAGASVQTDAGTLLADRLAVPIGFFDMEALSIAQGVMWPDGSSGSACMLGAGLAQALRAAVGQTLIVDGRPCMVSGVLAPHARLVTEGTGLSAIDFDQSIYLPFQVLAGQFSHVPVSGLITRVAETERFEMAVAAVSRTLSEAHAGEEDFIVVVPRALAAQVDETQRLFALVMSTIAGLALLVGGIGIANSLLATVAEQTREIGLRMAVGATAHRVLVLYVFHALWICSIGAVSGALLGLAVASGVQIFAGWSVQLSVVSVGVGVFFALLTGVLSAAYPALRASRMSAAEALIDH